MPDTSLEFEHLFADSPLRKPVYASLFAILMVALLGIGAYNLLWPLYGGSALMIQTFAISAVISIVVSIPAIVLVWFLDRREHESPWLLGGAAVWGAVVSVSLSLIFGDALYGYLLRLAKESGGTLFGFSAETISAVLTTPIVEEIVKGMRS